MPSSPCLRVATRSSRPRSTPLARLVYSTYLGGTDHDRASDVAVDALGNAYVVGFTYSPDFPVTAGASLTSALQGGFVTKLAPGGAGLAYSTYLPGGLDPDASYNRIAVDASGNAHVAAVASPDLSTGGTAFPFVNPLPSPCGVVGGGIVVLKLAADGSALTYATPIGRFASEIGPAGITLDASGTAYVVGTAVRGIGATPDAIQPRSGGGFDGFLVQIADSDAPPPLGASSTPGLRLAFGTYLGGNDFDDANGVTVDADGFIYVAGVTDSLDFPSSREGSAPPPGRARRPSSRSCRPMHAPWSTPPSSAPT